MYYIADYIAISTKTSDSIATHVSIESTIPSESTTTIPTQTSDFTASDMMMKTTGTGISPKTANDDSTTSPQSTRTNLPTKISDSVATGSTTTSDSTTYFESSNAGISGKNTDFTATHVLTHTAEFAITKPSGSSTDTSLLSLVCKPKHWMSLVCPRSIPTMVYLVTLVCIPLLNL